MVGITRLQEKYERERKLPGNEKDSFEETKSIGGTGFAFVQTKELSFLVQHTPNLGPSWSKCLSIEYRPAWGGILEDRDREAIGALVGFLSGRELTQWQRTNQRGAHEVRCGGETNLSGSLEPPEG